MNNERDPRHGVRYLDDAETERQDAAADEKLKKQLVAEFNSDRSAFCSTRRRDYENNPLMANIKKQCEDLRSDPEFEAYFIRKELEKLWNNNPTKNKLLLCTGGKQPYTKYWAGPIQKWIDSFDQCKKDEKF